MRQPVDAVLFDAAGTLLTPRPAEAWVAAAVAEHGLDLPRAEVAALAAAYRRAGLPGGPEPEEVPTGLERAYARRDVSGAAHRTAYVGLLATVAAPAPVPAPTLAEAVYAQVLRPEGWLPYADAGAVVNALVDAGIAIGLVSNVGFDLRPVLRAHGLVALTERCTLSFEHGVAKPDPAIFRIALDGLGTAPEAALMVGDHPVSDAGAVALGCRTLLLPMSPPGAVHGLRDVLSLALSSGAPATLPGRG